MKKIITAFSVLSFSMLVLAQGNIDRISRTTLFEKFQPATIILENGDTTFQKEANIFLKGSSLIYKYRNRTMEAYINQIKAVRFQDSSYYVRVDTALAQVIDTLSDRRLLCVTVIDVDAYRTQLLNERQITNFELGEHVNVTSTDLLPEDEERSYPLRRIYYFDLDGKIIKVQERNVKRLITKDDQRIYKTIIQSPGFTWDDVPSLMKLLRLTTTEK